VTASAQRLAARIEKARSIEECHQIARDMLSIAKKAKKDRSSRRRDRTTRATGRTKEDRVAEAAELYAYDRGQAFARAGRTQADPARCEFHYDNGIRCPDFGDDPDHVLGGASRSDSERLGAEGLMILCRQHHDMKHASTPTRGYWLDQAEAHALRIGAKRLLPLIHKARAKYAAKHGAAIRLEVSR
jgi:hypothetical protein